MFRKELDLNEKNIKKTIEKDILNRKSKLVMLSKLLAKAQENLVISIDGKWGSGKTFFVKQLKYLIENINDYNDNTVLNETEKEGFKLLKGNSLVVYYNAWENDNHVDPLESLIYNILNEYPSMQDQIADFGNLIEVLKSFAANYFNTKTKGLINLKSLDKLNSFADLASEIKTSEEKKKAFNKLIDALLVNNQRLILIIDELDRCKPTFAVEMLETIKHFYDNNKITIIISTNNAELSSTIKKFYGDDFDGYSYLNKFYDFIVNLESSDIKNYLQKQFNFANKTYIYHDISCLLMDHFNFSLRECNRYITLYNLLKKYIEKANAFSWEYKYIISAVLIPLTLALKIKDIAQYNLFISKKGEKIIDDFLESKILGTYYERWLKECISSDAIDLKTYVLECYDKIFDVNGSQKYFFDVISLLGTEINIEDKDKE